MGGIVGSAVGGIASGLLGGGGSSSSSQQQSSSYSYTRPSEFVATPEAILASIPVFQDATKQAQGLLTRYNEAATSGQDPYITTSYNALDQLLDSMGISRPQMGTYQALQAEKKYNEDLKNKPGGTYGPVSAADQAAYDAKLAEYKKAKEAYNPQGDTSALYNQLSPKEKAIVDGIRQNQGFTYDKDWQTWIDDTSKMSKQDIMDKYQYDASTAEAIKAMTPDQKKAYSNENAKRYQEFALNTLDPTRKSDRSSAIGNMSPDEWFRLVSSGSTGTDPGAAPEAPKGAYQAPADVAPFNNPMTDPTEAGKRIMQQLEADPNYQFQMKEGTRAIGNQGSARGMVGSTRLAKELQTYGAGLASSALSQYRDRLSQIIAGGQSAANTNSATNATTGAQSSQLATALGDKIAAAQMDASRRFIVGPKTSETTSNSSGSGSSGDGKSFAGTAGGSFLKGLGSLL